MPSITKQPSNKDSDLYEGSKSTNYGSVNEVKVYGNYSASIQRNGLLKFILSGDIPLGSTISSATFSLYQSGGASGHSIEINQLTQTAWVEDECTWDDYSTGNAWTAGGGDYTTDDQATSDSPGSTNWQNWTVTAQVQTALDSVNGVAHFLCKFANVDTSANCLYYSREYATASLRPKLAITYTVADVTVQPTNADAGLYELTSTTNYGSDAYARVSRENDSTRDWNFLGKFDFSGDIDAGATIDGAALKLYCYAHTNGNDAASLSTAINRLTQTGWVEGEVCWDNYSTGNAWTTGGGDYTVTDEATSNHPEDPNWEGWGVTNQVQTALDSVSGVYHFVIRQTHNMSWKGAAYRTSEYSTDTSLRPKLEINYTAGGGGPGGGGHMTTNTGYWGA